MTKERLGAIAGTILFHATILLVLLFYYLKPADNSMNNELGGVPVMLVNATDAFGTNDPQGDKSGLEEDIHEDVETDLTTPNNIESNNEIVEQNVKEVTKSKPIENKKASTKATQDAEKTIPAVDNKKSDADKRTKEAEVVASKKKAEENKKANKEAERKKNINSQMAGLFGKGNGSGSRGTTQGSGTQGSPSGNSTSGKLSGVAGLGSYDLGGRGLGANGLVLPSYNVDDYGTVVVDIIVDPQGNVIEATIGKGTTTANGSLRSESLKAAKRTKFSIVKTSNNQRGTITYKFNLN